MKTARMLVMCCGVILALAPLAARADHTEMIGRTGLPTVREAQSKIWMERGIVRLTVIGDSLQAEQDFRISYPGPPMEKSARDARIEFREDFYRGLHGADDRLDISEAKGFTSWDAWVDGERMTAEVSPWELNAKKDTATRHRIIRMHFDPGEVHRVRVVSLAPLGYEGNQRVINFVGKDIGHWRTKPDYLEIRVTMPGTSEAFLTALEPKPNTISRNGIRWIYRKADPSRDVMIKLPADWKHASLETDEDDNP